MEISIYNIESTVRAALDNVIIDEETGEIIGLDAAEAVCTASADKIENTAKYIRTLRAQIAAMKEAEKEIAGRRARAEKLADRFTDLIGVGLKALDVSKLEAADISIKIQKNPVSVMIVEPEAIPATYMTVPKVPAPVPNKTVIKEALKLGVEVPGARLEQTTRIVIK